MQRFLHSHTIGQHWQDICRDAVTALGDIPADAGLGFVYFTDGLSEHVRDILAYLRRHTPVTHWVGTSGHGIVGTAIETYGTPALSLLVTDIGPDCYRLVSDVEEDAASFFAATRDWRHQHHSFFSVVHGDPSNPKTPQLINQFAQGLQGGFLVGGLSSGESERFPLIAGSPLQAGLSGVLFASEVAVATGVSQGCSLIGKRHEVTEAEGNIAMSLDGKPALEVFKSDIGEVLARNLEQAGGYIFAAVPVAGSDTRDYLVRNLLGFDPESQALAVGDEMRVGMQLQFARRDADTAREDLLHMLRHIKARVSTPPKGALYFCCLGRGRHLFGDDSQELRLIQRELGDLPLTGFYANGEISHNRLYGYTGVLTLFH